MHLQRPYFQIKSQLQGRGLEHIFLGRQFYPLRHPVVMFCPKQILSLHVHIPLNENLKIVYIIKGDQTQSIVLNNRGTFLLPEFRDGSDD